LLTHLTRSEYSANEIDKLKKANPEEAAAEDARVLDLRKEKTDGGTSYAGVGEHNIGSEEIRSDGQKINYT
jgi:hypothetical protein